MCVFAFFVADTQLYKSLCSSVSWSVGPSISPSLSMSRKVWKHVFLPLPTCPQLVAVYQALLAVDTLCPSVGQLVLEDKPKSGKTNILEAFWVCLCWDGGWMGRWVWMGVGYPFPPVRSNILTPHHLFNLMTRMDQQMEKASNRVASPRLKVGH